MNHISHKRVGKAYNSLLDFLGEKVIPNYWISDYLENVLPISSCSVYWMGRNLLITKRKFFLLNSKMKLLSV